MKKGVFSSFDDLRRTFSGVDRVGKLTVFNIGGNKARIQGLTLNMGVKTAINPPARRLMMLKLRASVV